MKKSLYFASAAAVLFAACNEDFSDWAPAQSTAEGEATVAEGSVTALAPLSGSADTDRFQVLALNSAKGHITTNKLFLNDVEIPFAIQNDTVSVAKADLVEIARKSMFSMAAEERELAITGNWALLNDNGEATPLTIEPVKVKYTAAPLPANASEEAYYYVGGYNGWNLASPTKFENMGDGVFQLTINIGDSEWFAFAPQSAVDAGPEHGGWDMLFRAPSNGSTDTQGFLDNDPSTGFSFCCEQGGQYTFILNMKDYTYKYVHYIEKEYFYIGAANGNNQSKAYPLSNGGKDPLENPVFTGVVPATGGWHWFKIAPASAFNEDGSWTWGDNELKCACAATNDCEEMSGKFVIGGDKNSWHILEDQYPGLFYKLSFNFLTQEYSITPLNFTEYIYVPGNAQGWSPERAAALKGNGEGLFTGFAYMDGQFKFTKERNWNNGEYNNASFTTASEAFELGSGDGGNLNCTTPGVYYFEVNVATGDLKATKVDCMGLIGDFNGWGSDDAMTWDAENLCFVKTGAKVTSNGWKFRINSDWAINLGGDKDDLTQDGSDLKIAGSTIKLYPCRTSSKNIYCTIE